MHSQLEENTRLSELMLKDVVSNKDVCELLDEIWGQYLESKEKNGITTEVHENPYTKIKEKLINNQDLNKGELETLLEILQNINKLFRTYGKRAKGFGNFLTKIDQKRKESD